MKKQLLFGTAFLAAVTTFAQSGGRMYPTGTTDLAKKFAEKFQNNPSENGTTNKNYTPAQNPVVLNETSKEADLSSVATTTINWKLIAGSMNCYGMLVSESKPLQYNDNLNAVSFIHRKSTSYNALPTSNSGAIVAQISLNWGTTFDSTCIWSDATNLARYPQGGIYNPPGNTNINNAYVVGTGPVTGGSGWLGNWFASKQLGTTNYNATASAVPNAMQFKSNTGPFSNNFGKSDFSRVSFSATDDGVVRSVGMHFGGDNAGTTFATQNYRGAVIAKGTFNSGVFVWTTDSIIPSGVAVRTDFAKSMSSNAQLAWNEAGTTGYAVFIGAAATATGSNFGWQPIVYKTTNSGTSWALINGIDFNSPAMLPIKKPLDPIWSSTVANQTPTVPLFNTGEGIAVVVDINDRLHIVSTISSSGRKGVDSLTASYSYSSTNDPTNYGWPHTPGHRPYIYDFIGDGTGAWTFLTVDSMSSEDPGSATTDAGYSDNPWDGTGTGGAKINMDARIQASRTPDGRFITYSWTESDTNATQSTRKFNTIPNIKTRATSTPSGAVSSYVVSSNEINVSKPATGQGTLNASVVNRATLHYMSPTSSTHTITGNAVDLKIPFTVTNSQPYSQLTNNATYYTNNVLTYSFATVSIKEVSNTNSASNSVIYPNPTKDNATLSITVDQNSAVTVSVYNLVGALVKTTTANASIGANTIAIDLSNLTAGVYITNVKVGNSVSTKKLVIE